MKANRLLIGATGLYALGWAVTYGVAKYKLSKMGQASTTINLTSAVLWLWPFHLGDLLSFDPTTQSDAGDQALADVTGDMDGGDGSTPGTVH